MSAVVIVASMATVAAENTGARTTAMRRSKSFERPPSAAASLTAFALPRK
jgi:hypothetical protein